MARDLETRTNTLSWVAIGTSILALIISLVALNQPARVRLAETTAQNLQTELQTQIRSLQQRVEINQARQQLEDIRQRVATGGTDLTQAQKDITDIRNDLKNKFQDATDATKQSWQQLDDQLNQVEINLREGGVNALDAIDKAINTLKTNIKYD
ncbi:hypothetical protein HYS96_05050 [Candidatus Daviesbacteria bacterium]|nr:hypothetical protein [Candidatus Daviesbacteria bacterium]